MRYFAVQHIDPNIVDFIICRAETDYAQKWGLLSSDLFVGKKIFPKKTPKFYYSIQEGSGVTDIITNNLAWFLVSKNFQKKACALNLDNIQFIDVDIIEISSGKIIEGYAALNVVGLMDVIDYSHCSFLDSQNDQLNRFIVKYSLYRDCVKNFDFVRPEGNPGILIVSERVKNIFRPRKITGVGFRETKTY